MSHSAPTAVNAAIGAPMTGHDLSLVVFSRGFGVSMDGYGPPVNSLPPRPGRARTDLQGDPRPLGRLESK